MRSFGPILGCEREDLGTPREIRSPYDGRAVGQVRFGNETNVTQAIDLAVERFPSYSRTPAHQRSAWLRAIAAGIAARTDELGALIADEAGKPIRLARLEAARAPTTFRTAAEEALRLDGEILSLDKAQGGEGRLGLLRRYPLGPVSAISPFNFPLNLASHKVAAALAAGNTVVLKPASQTPMSAIMLGRIALEAGVPEGVFSVIPCQASDAAPLIKDPRARVLSFTGSAEIGWGLKAQAARKHVVLELGGNAGAIVERDADIDFAAERLALGAFMYAGQICISVQRIFVQEEVAARFIEAFLQTTREKIRCGDPLDEGVIAGPMIDAKNADRIQSWFTQAVDSGGTCLLKPRRDGNVLSPGVLTRVPKELPIVAQEAFGPVVVIEEYREYEEALGGINESTYGLQAAVFTNDVRKIMQAYDRLEVGGIIHNEYPTYRVDPMPYGGVKESGCGREGPRYAIKEMTEMRLLVLEART